MRSTWYRRTRWIARTWVHGLLTGALLVWAVPTVDLPPELEPYFASIRQVESRGHPWSIYDNTARRSYRLNNRAEAETKAKELIERGHNLDLGMMQLNCRYQCKRPGVSVDNIFDPDVNVATAKIIFLEFWVQARKVSTDFLTRIVAAVGAYNNGRVSLPNPTYVSKVWAQMGKSTNDLPVEGNGTPAHLVASAGGALPKPSKSRMDDFLGRFNQGGQWARDRIAALTGNDDRDPNARRKSRERKETAAGLAATGVIAVGAVAIGALLLLCVKVFGIFATLKALRIASALAKSNK